MPGLALPTCRPTIPAVCRASKQDLAQPPSVPEHEQTSTGGPLIVEVEIVAREVKKVVNGSGTEIHARTFNGTIPDALIVRHAGGSCPWS